MDVRKKERFYLQFPELSFGASVCIVAAMATLCYHTAAVGDFVFDDTEAVVNNDDTKPSTPLFQLFNNDFWGTRITHSSSHKSYRPLTVLTYRLNVMAAGGELYATQFRLINVILYIIVCCLSLCVCNLVCGETHKKEAFIAALLFTVHPVHSEAVAPVVGRADLLCTLFMFSAFLVYSCGVDIQKKFLFKAFFMSLTILFTTISMFCKEQGITVLAVCGAYDVLISQKTHPRKMFDCKLWKSAVGTNLLFRAITLLIAAIVLFISRWWIMGGTAPVFQKVDNPASFMDSFTLRAINYIYIYALNVWLLICPEWLCFDWSMGCVPLINSAYDLRIVWVIVFSTAFGLLVLSFLKNANGESRRCLVAFAFMVIPFLPASNLFFRVGFVIAERTLFVPSLGFCLLVALGLRRIAAFKIFQPIHVVLPVALVFIVLVFCLRSHFRSSEWASERVLFLSALKVCPLNAKVHYNLAKTSSNHTVARKHYNDALRLNPDYDQAMNNLANILKDIGELSEAETLLRRALKLRPDFAAAWMNLGIVLSNKKQFAEAEKCYWNAINFRRKYPDCYYNLGNLYLEQNDHSKAYESWRQATSLNPKHHAAWINLIIMLDSIGKHAEATSVGQEALLNLPNSSAIHFNIANSLGKTNNFLEAEKHFRTAIHLNPKYPLYYLNLGVLYHRWKKYGLAKEMYQLALKLDPRMKSAKDNLHLLKNQRTVIFSSK